MIVEGFCLVARCISSQCRGAASKGVAVGLFTGWEKPKLTKETAPKKGPLLSIETMSRYLGSQSVFHRWRGEIFLDELEYSNKWLEKQARVGDCNFCDVLDESAHVLLLNVL